MNSAAPDVTPSFLAFEPFPIGPQAMLHRDGLRDLQGRRVTVLSHRDARALVIPLQALVCAAIAALLPKPMADGRDAWSVVAQGMLDFRMAASPDAAIAATETFLPILNAALFVAEHERVPVSHEVAALSVLWRVHRAAFYVTDAEADAYAEAVRAQEARRAMPMFLAGGAIVAPALMDNDDPDLLHPFRRQDVQARMQAPTPWPAMFGADLPLCRTVGEVAARLSVSDILVHGDRVAMNVFGRAIGLDLAEEGHADLQAMLGGLNALLGIADRCPEGQAGGYGYDGHTCTMIDGELWSIRVQATWTRGKTLHWCLRFLRPSRRA